MHTFVNILIALLMLSVIIIIHEFGHFIFARINGVTVNDFSLGLGPVIFSKKIGQTKFSLRAFPIGGSCMMKGDDGQGAGDDEDSFASKKLWQRFSIVLAGPVFNFILAFVLSLVIIGWGGYDPAYIAGVSKDADIKDSDGEAYEPKEGDLITEIDGKNVVIGRDFTMYTYFHEIDEDELSLKIKRDGKEKKYTVTPIAVSKYYMGISYSADDLPAQVTVIKGNPAEKAGLRDGDTITAINGTEIKSGLELQNYMAEHPLDGSELTLTYVRGTKPHDLTFKSEYTTNYSLGFSANTYREKANALQTIRYSFTEVRFWIDNTIHSLFYMATGHVHKEDVGGAVRITKEISDVVEESKQDGTKYVILNLLFMCVLISANLGVMNLLPIPALDGGRLLFMLIELIRGKPLPPEKEAIVHLIGFALLMVLMVFILYNDIRNVFFVMLPKLSNIFGFL